MFRCFDINANQLLALRLTRLLFRFETSRKIKPMNQWPFYKNNIRDEHNMFSPL